MMTIHLELFLNDQTTRMVRMLHLPTRAENARDFRLIMSSDDNQTNSDSTYPPGILSSVLVAGLSPLEIDIRSPMSRPKKLPSGNTVPLESQ